MASSRPPEHRGRVLDAVRDFGTELSALLELSIGTRVLLQARWREEHNDGRLGYKLDPAGIPSRIPLPGPSGEPSCYLYLLFRLTINDAGYPVTTKSALRLYLDDDDSAPSLLRYEYLRDYSLPFPNPHLHVEADATEGWKTLNERTGQKKGIGQLHLPMGGKRYRPSVEDFLEFLITEGYVRAQDGWEAAIETVREKYRRGQLGAAVVADPESAAESLRELGYKVKRSRR